jgi:hypothetical protein
MIGWSKPAPLDLALMLAIAASRSARANCSRVLNKIGVVQKRPVSGNREQQVSCRPVGGGSAQRRGKPGGARNTAPAFNSGELKPREPQEFEPVRMALSGHQFLRAFADPLGTLAAKEGAVIEEELQQIEIRRAQLAAEEEIAA